MKNLCLGLMTALVFSACGRTQRSAPLLGQAMPGPQESRLLFEDNCHHCHPHGGAGLGPALNNKPLPEFAIKAQTRKGLGAMPKFTEGALSDESLDKIAKYVQALRRTE